MNAVDLKDERNVFSVVQRDGSMCISVPFSTPGKRKESVTNPWS